MCNKESLMSPQELATKLNGREYGNETSVQLERTAKENNLVIAFGYSDDNLELRGAIRDEYGAYDGTTAKFYCDRNVGSILTTPKYA